MDERLSEAVWLGPGNSPFAVRRNEPGKCASAGETRRLVARVAQRSDAAGRSARSQRGGVATVVLLGASTAGAQIRKYRLQQIRQSSRPIKRCRLGEAGGTLPRR